MAIELWEDHELYQLQRDNRFDPVPSYFLDTFFTETYYSEDRKIRFAELPKASRALAPFVLPTEQGKPIFSRKGESVTEITPPYIKPKDAVRAVDARNVLPSEYRLNGGSRPSLEQRFDQRVAEITEFHLRAIRMQKAWMAARAIIDAKVQINYEHDQGASSPNVLLDFGRDAGHTITLGAGQRWDDVDHSIMTDVESWMNTMYLAKFGGSASMMIVGAQVASLFRKNNEIKAKLDKNFRGSEDVNIKTGILRTEQPLKYIGSLAEGLDIWTYRDYVENANGDAVDIMDPRDVLLVAPGATGVDAHGAIYNDNAVRAGMASVDVYPSMWTDNDPTATYLMHESSPLPIPLYPNRTLKARVIA